MRTPEEVEIERIRYWQGQRLRSRDFRDQVKFDAQLRWWHDRALHNSFGVSFGFAVEAVIHDDALTAVRVGCGVAYDCFGRELILQASRALQLPAPSNTPPSSLTLVAHYKDDSQFPSRRQVASTCADPIEEPVFLWKRSSRIEIGEMVPIARVTYESAAELESLPTGLTFSEELAARIRYDTANKQLVLRGAMTEGDREELLALSAESSFKEAVEELFQKSQQVPVLDESFSAPKARALARPRIGAGATVPGQTAWEVWSERVFTVLRAKTDMPLGMQVTIDTSTAGFTEVPRYFAWLEGSLWDQSYVEFFPAPLAHIDQQSSTTKEFRFRLWMPNIIGVIGKRLRIANQQFTTEFLNFAQSKKLYVCWLGVQCAEEIACDEVEDCHCQTVNED